MAIAVKHNPADKRGLGMVFLGMQSPRETVSESVDVEFTNMLIERLDELENRVFLLENRPGLWKRIAIFFKELFS
jgi:hypothetical protein